MSHATEFFAAYYASVESRFRILPDAEVMLADDPPGSFGIAYYHGFSAAGLPQFSIRADFNLASQGFVAAHEIGHALEEAIRRFRAGSDPLALYWSARGFPGTYQQAFEAASARVQSDTLAGWRLYPQESWAECFRICVAGGWGEQTENYSRPIDVGQMLAFFTELGRETEVDEATVRNIVREEIAAYAQNVRATFEGIDGGATRESGGVKGLANWCARKIDALIAQQ